MPRDFTDSKTPTQYEASPAIALDDVKTKKFSPAKFDLTGDRMNSFATASSSFNISLAEVIKEAAEEPLNTFKDKFCIEKEIHQFQ